MAEAGPSRWRPVMVIALVTVLGLALGAASALWTMKRGGLSGVGGSGWAGSTLTGSPDADPWTRAQVARTGLLALNRSQAIYFARNTDDSGARLKENCRYRVSGGPLPGRWWSMTVYADDDFLPLNNDDALSFDATEVRPDAAGIWTALVAPSPEPGQPWASTSRAGDFNLTLRIYNPTPAAQRDFSAIALPSVVRLGCGDPA